MPAFPKITLLMFSYPIFNAVMDTLRETAGLKDNSVNNDESLHFDPNTVVLEQGVLKGTGFSSGECNMFRAFMGIPYAKPPIGDLRFQAGS